MARRIDELLRGQTSLVDATLSETGQELAQRYVAQLIALRGAAPDQTPVSGCADAPGERVQLDRFQEVDLDSIDLVRARSVGVVHAALSVMRQCAFADKLSALGLNRPQIAAVVGTIIARIAHPGSELASHAWLQQRSALGELIDFDFEAMDLNRLYRASDVLHKHREILQEHLFAQAQSLFALSPTVTLYDLTNTYFEGIAAGVSKARRGHRKECRSDCPLVTLAMALDASGFPRRSRVFAGNDSEPTTLAEMITGLGAAPGATVVMDSGIANDANLVWLRAQGLPLPGEVQAARASIRSRAGHRGKVCQPRHDQDSARDRRTGPRTAVLPLGCAPAKGPRHRCGQRPLASRRCCSSCRSA